MQYPSKLIEEAVNQIAKLPGIGKKTAIRLALHLLKQNEEETDELAFALVNLRKNIKSCNICHIISDSEECTCINLHKDTSIICVVEDTPDVMAIENTAQYNGLYHVLGGVISPINGIGPDELNIGSLIKRIKSNPEIKEIILALNPTLEGDTTAFYITKKIKGLKLKITAIARGIPVGGELEYADEVTLGRSIISRRQYNEGE